MKIDNIKLKLKDIRITPFHEIKDPKDLSDVMYLYYTLVVKRGKTVISFEAYDFPVLDKLTNLYDGVNSLEPNYDNELQTVWKCDYINFGYMEHNINLKKSLNKQNNSILYTLHIYEELGNSIVLILRDKELVNLIEYIEKKIQKAIKNYTID